MLFTFFHFFILSQEIDLNGNIIEKETGSPMSGATIQIVGSDIGVVSDFDGNFSITIKIGEKIKVSYVGMKTIEIPIISTPVKIEMETDLNQLDEVMVSVGYFDISEKDLSGSITQIKSEQLEKNRSSSVESILKDKFLDWLFQKVLSLVAAREYPLEELIPF